MKVDRIFIYIFGIVFITGGIISIISGFHEFYRLQTAAYKQQATFRVLSIKVEKDWIAYSDTRKITGGVKNWNTEEQTILDNGQKLVHYGSYARDPGGEVSHTVISNDGINWEVNDSSLKTSIIGSAAGVIFIAAGAAVMTFGRRRSI